jgi:hypothetical protein
MVWLQRPGRAARIAVGLWIVWAVILWNVVFDHVIVVAGRSYISAAVRAAAGPGPYARMDDWMRPAITRAFWTASAAAGVLLVFLLIILLLAPLMTSTRATAAGPGRSSHR